MSAPIVPEPAEKMNYNTFDGLETGHKSAEAIRKSLAHIGQLQGNEDILPEHEENLKVFERMYQFERIKRPYHLGHLLLLLYVPVGIMLLILRLSILFTTALIVPNLFSENQIDRFGIHKAYCLVTGTIVRVNNKERLSENNPPPIIVANHISEFDAVALRWLCPSYVLGYDFYKKMLFFRLLKDKFGLVYVPYGSRTQGNGQARDELREVIVERLNRGDKPLMCFPEGGLTNGRLGLLQYHKFLFSLGKEIQPLAIRVTDGPFPVNINDETSTFVANVLWYFFIPWHVYTITVMPRTHAEPDEDALAFAQRVMKDTARLLDQQATAFLYRDKITFTRYKNKVLKGGKRDK
ncbi:TPA: hypothetical protein N0F65_007901 [Lagenidium giganteum]|uniref:Phospholipid/glycerol acyltransferase domain-containing protein n=1 Tax=Lagenidium giganteum TaxID=4803 RepID=A0AAV2Z3C3_9STRA|nr:TPA: hypothetical protein N0F65_007901 [Lagenidium giganteum]